MDYANLLDQTKDVVRRLRYFEYLDNLLYFDRWAGGCPKDGFSFGQEVNGFVVKRRDDLLMSDDSRRAVSALKQMGEGDFASDVDRGAARWLIRRFDEAVKVPAELSAALSAANAEGQRVWAECLAKKDFQAFLPALKTQFDLQEKIARAIAPEARVYDTIMSRCDPSYTCDEVDQIFEAVKTGVSDVLEKSGAAWEGVDASVVSAADEGLSAEAADALVAKVSPMLGANPDRTTSWRVHHPVTVCMGPRDGRPSTYSYGVMGVVQSMIAKAHETGHSLYGCGSSDEVVDAGLWGGIEGFMHESQSRFYENHVFRGKAFWQSMLPVLREACPGVGDVDVETFWGAINKPVAGPSRLKADELTYPLHIIIRHELERDYFDGKLALADFEDAWNEKYQSYLGVTPADASEGVLSDVHWASGCVGYFFSYALGDLYAAQFEHALLADVPDAYGRLAAGDATAVRDWLATHVWCHGQTYTAPEALRVATGEDLNPQYYVNYLSEKFSI